MRSVYSYLHMYMFTKYTGLWGLIQLAPQYRYLKANNKPQCQN